VPTVTNHMRKSARRLALTGAAVVTLAVVATAQTSGVHPISGRRYAQTMSYLGADWLDRNERVEEEAPERALDVLKLAPGSIVADVGAGSGYMTVKMAQRVGPTGRVYANDIQPEMLALLRQRVSRERIGNVQTVLGTLDDPKLPAAAIDLILMVDVYHEFSEPQKMLRRMHEALKPAGRLVLLEYRKEDPAIPIKPDHKMSVAEARMEVEAEGYTLTTVDESLPRQHILIFTRR
jgi:ubiquinone/menaquinone biosynthesis C-methylase UbiE